MGGAQAQGGVGRVDASPGLLRRRYSVPETIMRKYRLAQQCSESEEAATSCARHSASATRSPHRDRPLRHDRELMRKSALLRRLWARPAACACCESRSLTGSRSELRRSPPAWTSPPVAAPPSDSTFQSHAGDACCCIDAFTDSEPPPPPSDDISYSDSDPYSTSLSTAKEMAARPQEPPAPAPVVRRVFDRSTFEDRVDGTGRARAAAVAVPYDRPLAVDTSAPYELLEIVVSESVNGAGAPPPPPTGVGAGRTAPSTHDLDIDRYVSNILVESLNSLTDQLESMNASIGNDRKVNIVEKEIKVRLQNTGVNTIVHLSPTSNNQIIFGNEELCNEETTTGTGAGAVRCRDECNNPVVIRDEPESNGNETPAGAGAGAAEPPVFDALRHDDVNEAVLQQIQKLFRDELRHLDDDVEAISHVEVSNVVDVYVEERADLIGGVGAGNYYTDSRDAGAALVPRFSAFPHTDSMEVNTSSSEEVDLAGSECTSLVDSLDDPNSPRAPLASARGGRRALVRSAIDVLDLLPERAAPAPAPPPEAFFIRIEDDRVEPDSDDVRVAEYMPEKIKQRLYRRQRKRELRIECARRGKNQLKRQLEVRRREDAAAEACRRIDRDCRALLDDILDDVIAKIVHDEFKCMRIKRRNRLQAKSDETMSRRTRRISHETRRTSLEIAPEDRCRRVHPAAGAGAGASGDRPDLVRHQVHGKLLARPSASLASSSRPPRRFYQKSEIHEGDKCIEILEILEYVNGSQSSPDTANSDESQGQGSRSKKSRIPVPVYERSHRSSTGSEHMRLTGGDGRRSRAAAASGPLAHLLLLDALPEEPRSQPDSLRFRRVFDIIPEERSSLSLEECEGSGVATSPPPRRLADHTTMTSPYTKSAGTSPMRPPPSPPREGHREVGVGPIELSPARTAAAVEGATRREVLDGDRSTIRDEATTDDRPGGTDVRQERAGRDRRPTAPGHARDGSLDRTEAILNESTGRDGKARREGGAGAGRDRVPRRRRPPPPAPGDGDSSDSADSGGSLLCSLAPRWLSTQARRERRRLRRPPPPAPASPQPPPPPPRAPMPPAPVGTQSIADAQPPTGGWSVTVAGSCRAALPHDVEMRLRFPQGAGAGAPRSPPPPQTCACVQCAACARAASRARAPLPLPSAPAPPPPLPHGDPTLTLTMKKEAQDSSIVASKTCRKSREHLPELETYRASRSKVKSSMKTRRGYSLHCWLPDDEPAPIRGSSGLSVLGCAIIPEVKPRVPTMSERDLTRLYTPRHYLRS